MGCNTCKQKNGETIAPQWDHPHGPSAETETEKMTIPLIPHDINGNEGFQGNFLFKVIALGAVIIALPFIIVVLIGQVFLQFFAPNALPGIAKKFNNFFTKILTAYGVYRAKKEIKKRKKQFDGTIDYSNIEVVENENNKEVNDE